LTHSEHHIGGGVSELFSLAQLQPYLLKNHMMLTPSAHVMYKFEGHHTENKQLEKDLVDVDTVLCDVPLGKIIHNLTITSLKLVAAVHGIYIKSRTPLPEVLKVIQDHNCDHCQKSITVLKSAKSPASRRRETNAKAVVRYRKNKLSLNKKVIATTQKFQHHKKSEHVSYAEESEPIFPPASLDVKMQHDIVKAWCKNMSPKNFEEVGCAICGELSLKSKSVLLKDISVNLNMLQSLDSITRKERKSENDSVESLDGPIVEPSLRHICARCHKAMASGKLPKISLANGM